MDPVAGSRFPKYGTSVVRASERSFLKLSRDVQWISHMLRFVSKDR